MSELVIRHDRIRRGRRTVLEAARFAVPAPASIAVVGVNGSGKSSLFLHLCGLLLRQPAPAELHLGAHRPTLALVPQEPALPAWLSVGATAALYGAEFNALLERHGALHLDELKERRVGDLSAGQRQTLAVVLAMSRNANLTLLDEPFSALDFRRRIGLLDLLRERRASGGSFMLSSQAAADLAEVCDYFIVLRAGRVVFQGPRAELAAGDLRDVETRLLELLTA
jgi:ABC-2 type transport system ATP-binding protein